MSTRFCGVAAALILAAVGLPAASAAAWPPWVPLSSGGGGVPIPTRPYGLLITRYADLQRFPPLALHPGGGDPFASFDFQANVVLVVVMRASELIEVKRVVRSGGLLQVGAGASGFITFGPGFAAWQAVSFPRRLLGRPLPGRIVFPWN
jgi:hypothetical protein